MSSLLTNLPISLGRSLLSQWLGAKSLSKLDIAHCSCVQHALFSHLLDGVEIADLGPDYCGPSYFGRLHWMNQRHVTCAVFKLVSVGAYFNTGDPPLTSHDIGVIDTYIQSAAERLRHVHVVSDENELTNVLRIVSAHKCALNTLKASFVSADHTDDQPWAPYMVAILVHSAQIMTELNVCSLGAFEDLAMTGVCFTALRKVDLIGSLDGDIRSICQAAPNIKELNLPAAVCSTAGFAAIATYCTQLETFWCTGTPDNIDQGIASIAKGCRKLKTLKLSMCMEVTDVGMNAIAAHCTQLEILCISSNDQVTDEWLVALAQTQQHTLLSLSVRSCSAITGAGIVAIATHCTRLNTLDISDCKFITEDNLLQAIAQLKCVKTLKLGNLFIEDFMLELIADNVPTVEVLSIAAHMDENGVINADYTSAGLLHIVKKCSNLKLLELGPDGPGLTALEYGLWQQVRPGIVVSNDRYD